jgi:hypothetical protein
MISVCIYYDERNEHQWKELLVFFDIQDVWVIGKHNGNTI